MLFRQPLGEMLLTEGLITQAQLDAALKAQAERGLPIGQLLVEEGAVTEAVLMGALARQLGLEFVDLAEYPIDRGAVALLPEAMARRLLALPVTWDDKSLVVAMADPGNVLAIDDMRAVTGAEITIVVATRTQLSEAIDRFHRLDSEVDEVAQIAAEELADDDDEALTREGVEDAPSSSSSTCSSPRRSPTGRPTSTSNRPSTTCGSGSGSTACSTRSCTPPARSRVG